MVEYGNIGYIFPFLSVELLISAGTINQLKLMIQMADDEGEFNKEAECEGDIHPYRYNHTIVVIYRAILRRVVATLWHYF